MYGIKCDGNFVHSIVPDDPLGIGIKLAGRDSPNFIKLPSIEDCAALVVLLEDHFPYDDFRIVKVGGSL